MNVGVTITGVQKTLDAIQQAVADRNRSFRSGIIAAGVELEAACTRKITEVLYSIPEEEDKERKRTGNLRASRFTMWTGGRVAGVPSFQVIEGEEPVEASHTQALHEAERIVNQDSRKTSVLVGYGAYYAIFVHEGVEGKFDGFKWVERALQDSEQLLVDRITGALR